MATSDISFNKICNEEFKIWKKTVPSLYKHIITLKPRYSTPSISNNSLYQTVVFSKKVVPNTANGTLNTTMYMSTGSEIYDIDSVMPLGLYNVNNENTLPEIKYDEVSLKRAANTPLRSKWTFASETIYKMIVSGENEDKFIIAMSKNGSLSWFNDTSRTPVYVEMITTEHGKDLDVDFDIKDDFSMIVRSCGNKVDIINNTDQRSKVINTIQTEENISKVQFISDDFIACVTGSRILFFDIKGENIKTPSFTLKTENKILSIDPSPFIDRLFVTGNETGMIELWDIRRIFGDFKLNGGKEFLSEPIINLKQNNNEKIISLQFSPISITELISIDNSGNIYHWDLSSVLYNQQPENEQDEVQLPDREEIENQCLQFIHTNGRHHPRTLCNSVAWHPVINNLVGSTNCDGVICIYQPFCGRLREETIDGKDL